MSGTGGDGELGRKLREGDVDAFVALCERHRARVWRIAVSVAPGADVEDVAQEAIIRAYRARRSFSGEAPFEAWLCRIALNVARDHARSVWRRRVLLFGSLTAEEMECEASPQGEVERREVQRRVRQAVAALPERQRVPIWLHYLEGFTLAEVARLEQAPEATVRSRMRAGLQRLSRSLQDLLSGAADCPTPLTPHRKGCGP